MIDLGSKKQKLYFIKLADGTVLKLRLPTRAMILDMVEMTEADVLDNSEAIDKLYNFLAAALNRNINGIAFSEKEVEEMLDIDTALLVLKDYMEYSFKKMGE